VLLDITPGTPRMAAAFTAAGTTAGLGSAAPYG
jgi:hypothetical protein